jgi:hypothetical protein
MVLRFVRMHAPVLYSRRGELWVTTQPCVVIVSPPGALKRLTITDNGFGNASAILLAQNISQDAN